MVADSTKRRLLAAMAIIVATPALGAWPYARWGMSPQQVVASSGGQVVLGGGNSDEALRDPKIKIRAVGTRNLGQWRLRMVFYFTNDRLGEIKAKVLNPDGCGGLSAHLSRAYGQPFVASHKGSINSDFWRDTGHKTIVHLLAIGTSCWVEYNPLTAASEQRIRKFYSSPPADIAPN